MEIGVSKVVTYQSSWKRVREYVLSFAVWWKTLRPKIFKPIFKVSCKSWGWGASYWTIYLPCFSWLTSVCRILVPHFVNRTFQSWSLKNTSYSKPKQLSFFLIIPILEAALTGKWSGIFFIGPQLTVNVLLKSWPFGMANYALNSSVCIWLLLPDNEPFSPLISPQEDWSI